jgi:para-nitrobenzyl esterase
VTIKRIRLAAACVFAVATLAACQDGRDAAAADTERNANAAGTPISDVIEARQGTLQGFAVDENGQTIHVFRQIPYAAPPVGDLRFRPPQPPVAWDGVRDATEWGNRCPQPSSLQGGGDISEDCLHLHVNTPARTTADRLPVMVFYHGGGLSIGTANSPVYTHPGLSRHGVILVTVNSRLGPIGYMAHPALSAESEHSASGHYGTLDLIASLHWIQDNIAAFGGDPDKVTIFGESGGGTKTLSLMASPLAKGLFHRAAVQSGSALISPERVTTLAAAEGAGERIAAQLGIDNGGDVAAALRAAGWQDIIAAASADGVGFTANLVVDGWSLPVSVHEMFREGRQHDVPLIVGANTGERGELQVVVPMLANLHGKTASSNAYVYNFAHMPAGWAEEGCVAFHGVEIPYVFGAIPDGLISPTILFLSRSGGCQSNDPGADERDHEVAENVMRLWTQFARTGDPSVDGLTEWPAYTEEKDRYLNIDYTLEVKQGIRDAYVAPPER